MEVLTSPPNLRINRFFDQSGDGVASVDVPLLDVRAVSLTPGQAFLKRAIDIIGAGIGLVLFFPVGLIIACFVKLDSKGPIFFRQRRMGQGGIIEVLKYRSMHVDADRVLTAVLSQDAVLKREYEKYHKLRNDPRVTRVGRILRKYSLDEFPQLWNVLRGEMSLVGPRPYLERERLVMKGQDAIILSVHPGLTGLWQTNGRNALSFRQRVELETYYVLHWSFWTDIKILVMTIPVLLSGEGAS